MNYTVDTTKSEKYNVLTVNQEIILLFNKKEVAQVELNGNTVTVTYTNGETEKKAYQFKPLKNSSKVMDNRARSWRRRE